MRWFGRKWWPASRSHRSPDRSGPSVQRLYRWCLVALLAALGTPFLLTAWSLWLRPISDLAAVDAIFVPNGDPDFARTRYAARLFTRGYGRWFVVSGQGFGGDSAPAMAAEAVKGGVPADRILIEPDATTTAENAVFSANLLAGHQIRRVLIVSSPLHLRRMALAARKAWPGVMILTAADEEPFDPWWWQNPDLWPIVGRETWKLIGYTLRGDTL